MPELGSIGWWESRWESKEPRRLARAFHSAYHFLLVNAPHRTRCPLTDRDGRLREILVSHLEMQQAIAGARAWCLNNYANQDHARIYAIIARRLPEDWAKSLKRCTFALQAFEQLCENRYQHEQGGLSRLSQKLGRSAASLKLDRLDFFLFAAAIALDDDAWQAATKGETEGEEKPC